MLLAFLHILLKRSYPKIIIPKIANGITTTNFSFNPTLKPEYHHKLVYFLIKFARSPKNENVGHWSQWESDELIHDLMIFYYPVKVSQY